MRLVCLSFFVKIVIMNFHAYCIQHCRAALFIGTSPDLLVTTSYPINSLLLRTKAAKLMGLIAASLFLHTELA